MEVACLNYAKKVVEDKKKYFVYYLQNLHFGIIIRQHQREPTNTKFTLIIMRKFGQKNPI